MGNIEINGYNFYIEACRAFKGCYVWKVRIQFMIALFEINYVYF